MRVQAQINPSFESLLADQSRFLILYGGAGSGKSHFAAQKILLRILAGIEDNIRHGILAIRKTQPAVRKSVFRLFEYYINLWKIKHLVHIRRQEMTFSFPNGSEIICAGLDDPEKIKSIEGITSAWMEEATEFTREDLRQVNLRLRGQHKAYKQVILSFNPINRLHWLYEQFFVNQQENCRIHHSTYRDNTFLDDEYRKELEGLEKLDTEYHRIYALGEWGNARNVILTNWQVTDVPTDPWYYDRVASGLDFGFNHPTALLRVGFKDGDVYVFDELYERGLTNQDLISRMRSISFRDDELITADSAEPGRIEEIRRAGFRIEGAKKGPGSILDGIDWLRRRKIRIHPTCVNTINEIQTWKYREDKLGNVLEDPVPLNDDAMSALRYASEQFRAEAPSFAYESLGRRSFATSGGF